jgi:phage terminase small subunit
LSRDTLTPKQHRFCIEYLKDRIGKEAAIRAGYSPNAAAQQAYELLQLPKIRAIVDAEQQDSLDRVRVDRDWVLEQLKLEATSAETDGARVRALELLGKELGMFVERKQVQHNHDHTFFANVDLTEAIDGEWSEPLALPNLTEPDGDGSE